MASCHRKVTAFRIQSNASVYNGIYPTGTTGVLFTQKDDSLSLHIDTVGHIRLSQFRSIEKTISYGMPALLIELKQDGAKQLEKLTEKHLHKPLAIILNNRLLMVPIVNEKITGGQVQVTGNFTLEELDDIIRAIRK